MQWIWCWCCCWSWCWCNAPVNNRQPLPMGESHAPDPPIVDHRRVRSCLCLPWEDTTDTLQNTKNTETNMKYQLQGQLMWHNTQQCCTTGQVQRQTRAVFFYYYERAVKLVIKESNMAQHCAHFISRHRIRNVFDQILLHWMLLLHCTLLLLNCRSANL